MANIQVPEFKIKLNNKEYIFRLDFAALIKFENKYKDAMVIFNNFLNGKNVYGSIIKILSCACAEKDFTEKELEKVLPFNFKTMKLVDEIVFALIEGMIDKSDGNEEKNEKTSQSKKE